MREGGKGVTRAQMVVGDSGGDGGHAHVLPARKGQSRTVAVAVARIEEGEELQQFSSRCRNLA